MLLWNSLSNAHASHLNLHLAHITKKNLIKTRSMWQGLNLSTHIHTPRFRNPWNSTRLQGNLLTCVITKGVRTADSANSLARFFSCASLHQLPMIFHHELGNSITNTGVSVTLCTTQGSQLLINTIHYSRFVSTESLLLLVTSLQGSKDISPCHNAWKNKKPWNLIFRNKVAIHHNPRLLTTTMISYLSKITALQPMLNPNDQKIDLYVGLTHNLVTIIHNRDTVNLVFQHQHSSICNTKSAPNEEPFRCYLNS